MFKFYETLYSFGFPASIYIIYFLRAADILTQADNILKCRPMLGCIFFYANVILQNNPDAENATLLQG